MRLYNVEVFRGKRFVSAVQVEKVEYKEDYVSPEKNKIKTKQKKFTAEVGDYILVRGPDVKGIGIVTGFEDNKGQREAEYETFLSLFDVDIYCAQDEMQGMTVEGLLAKKIRENFVENQDAEQNIEGLQVDIITGTQGSLQLEKNICNLLEDLIIPAFLVYQVVVDVIWDVQKREIRLQIKRAKEQKKTIEADLPNIFAKNIVLRKTKNDLNKVVVVNEENPQEILNVYRTKNDEITTEDRDRIVPVKFQTITTKAGKDQTFEETALQKAEEKLKKAVYENLIELETVIQDPLVKPGEIAIGQECTIIHDGKAYRSILTGRKIKGTETIIFGTVRLEFTKRTRRM